MFNDSIKNIALYYKGDSNIDENWNTLRTFFLEYFNTHEQIRYCVLNYVHAVYNQFYLLMHKFLETTPEGSSFLTFLMQEMSPRANNFTLDVFENIETAFDNEDDDKAVEVWTDSPCVLVKESIYWKWYQSVHFTPKKAL